MNGVGRRAVRIAIDRPAAGKRPLEGVLAAVFGEARLQHGSGSSACLRETRRVSGGSGMG